MLTLINVVPSHVWQSVLTIYFYFKETEISMHSLSPGSNYHIHTIIYILLFLGQIICSRNTCHSRKYLVISALVIGSREIIPEHFEHVTHAQAWLMLCLHYVWSYIDQKMKVMFTPHLEEPFFKSCLNNGRRHFYTVFEAMFPLSLKAYLHYI